jgi:hypothetical protein
MHARKALILPWYKCLIPVSEFYIMCLLPQTPIDYSTHTKCVSIKTLWHICSIFFWDNCIQFNFSKCQNCFSVLSQTLSLKQHHETTFTMTNAAFCVISKIMIDQNLYFNHVLSTVFRIFWKFKCNFEMNSLSLCK